MRKLIISENQYKRLFLLEQSQYKHLYQQGCGGIQHYGLTSCDEWKKYKNLGGATWAVDMGGNNYITGMLACNSDGCYDEYKKALSFEKRREKFEVSLERLQEENFINRVAQGQTIIDLKNKEFDVFRGSEEQMSEIRKNLSNKNLKLQELNRKEMLAIGNLSLIDEGLRAAAKLEIE